PNVKNIAVIRAENEYRYLFKAVDYAGQPGIFILDAMGNHCNIGGGYKHDGLGNLYLDATSKFFQKSGLNIADAAPDRHFEAGTKLTVYNESGLTREQAYSPFADYKHRGKWDVYSYFDPNAETQAKRLLDSVAYPAKILEAAEGTQQKEFKLYNGQQAIESQGMGEKARVYLQEAPEKAIGKHPDLLGAFVLRAITLKNIADMPTVAQQQVLARFDMSMVANIEQGNLPPSPNLYQPTSQASWLNQDSNMEALDIA
ncbi:MAG: hypothetical protein PHD12_08075, partial [Methylotenera sp.]|nr:hypothetical protein [Methylotenera sp.]